MPNNGLSAFNGRREDIRETMTEEEKVVIDTPVERTHFSDADIIAALENNEGNVPAAAEEIGCSEATVYLRSSDSPETLAIKPRLGGVNKYTPQQMIIAITNAQGNIQNAAVILNCSRATIKKYIARFPEVREVYLDQHDQVTDLAQSRLVEAIARGEPWALMFYYREYLPRYVLPIRGDSGRFPALLPVDESYDPDIDRLSDHELNQLAELAAQLTEAE